MGEGGRLSMVSVSSSLTGGASAYFAKSSAISSSEGKRSNGAINSSSSGYGDSPGGAKNSFIAT